MSTSTREHATQGGRHQQNARPDSTRTGGRLRRNTHFNAWFEVFLDGGWFAFDARHNARRIGRIPIARGRDACDVPMIQTFGPHVLNTFRVLSEEVAAGPAMVRAA